MDAKIAVLLATIGAAGGAVTVKAVEDSKAPRPKVDTVTLSYFPLTGEFVMQSQASMKREDGSFMIEPPGKQVRLEKNKKAAQTLFDLAEKARANPEEKF